MTQVEAQSEKWLLWTYGTLSAVLLLVFQFVDALVTDSPEPWYLNMSYIIGSTIGIMLAGVLLLLPFKHRHAVTLSIATALFVWPALWVGEYGAEMLINLAELTGERSLIVLVVCMGVPIAALPSAIEYLMHNTAKQKV